MKHTITRQTGIVLSTLMLSVICHAQSSSPEVFERVEKNIENAKANQQDNHRNLGAVSENLSEVTKARGIVQTDAAKLKAELAVNQKTQNEIERSLEQFKKSEDQEKKSIQNEEKKIADLEAMIKTLRGSIDKRQANLSNITSEREKIAATHAEWKQRGDQLHKLNAEAKVRDDRLATEEKEWRGKKSKYEKESDRWAKSLTEQEQVKKNLASLKGK